MQTAVAGNSEAWWKHAGSNVRRECHCVSRREVCPLSLLLMLLTPLGRLVCRAGQAHDVLHVHFSTDMFK